jgi:3-methyladenine DNA glycosylase AlkD
VKQVAEIMEALYLLADKAIVAQKEKQYGIVAKKSLGVKHSALAEIVKEIEKTDALAIALYDTGIYEAKILCSKIHNSKTITKTQMEKWVKEFDNWEICDSFCMGLFAKSKFAVDKILEWTNRENEFEKRAGFATMAAYCMADKKSDNKLFLSFLPIVMQHATDERNFVKKAVNWALRSIGKRNKDLHQQAIVTANKMLKLNNKTATWVAKDALREFEKENMRMSDYPRSVYR